MHLPQILFDRLYKGGSNLDCGTLLQLRNLINRRNVSKDTSGKFNSSVDFFELVVRCHIVAATLQYFGMKSIHDIPSSNAFPTNVNVKQQWKSFHRAVSGIIERYVFIQDFTKGSEAGQQQVQYSNPHTNRILHEHSYTQSDRSPCQQKQARVLPQSLRSCADYPNPSASAQKRSPDKILEYACSVMTDGLLLLELRDAIHEADGDRLNTCWKVMLLYQTYGGHRKYAIEALTLQASVHATASPRLAQEILTSRFINVQGGPGKNIPTDLYMEHLNRTLKDYMNGLGPNISSDSIVQISKSLKALMDTVKNFDRSVCLHPESLHHTRKSSQKDKDLIVTQLIQSNVFGYIPGRSHRSFKNIKSHISDCINIDKLIAWVKEHQAKIANNIELQNILHPQQ